MVLLERRVVLAGGKVVLDALLEVELREQAVVGHPVVLGSWLEVIQMLEAVGGGVGSVEWHE